MESECNLILSLDIGASLTKGFVTILSQGGKQIDPIKMESNVVELDRRCLSKIELLENISPENNAWIARKTTRSGKAIAVGALAKQFCDFKVVQIERVKYEYAVEKILAAIGAVIEKHELNRKGFEVAVNLVIPSDECEGRKDIEKSLKSQICQYQFRGEVIEGKLKTFNCYIEGQGGILYKAIEEQLCREENKGGNIFDNKKLGVIMLGYRNSSCLIFDKGSFSKEETERIGYFDFITDFRKQNVGQKISDLEEIIPRIGENEENKERIFKSLIRGERRNNQSKELKRLQETFEETKKTFWVRLQKWLDVHIPIAIDEILILGGTARQFKSEITEAYGYAKLYWGERGVDEMVELFPLYFKSDRALGYRFLDIYGIHKLTNNID